MNTILYFQSSGKTCTSAKLAGVRDIFEKTDWKLCLIEEFPSIRLLSEMIKIWQPIGCIVEGGTNTESGIDPEIVTRLPMVFFDQHPNLLPPEAFSVFHDSRATGTLAAREFILAGHKHFAFIHPHARHAWSRDRERGFADTLQLNGKTCHTFLPTEFPDSKLGSSTYQRGLRSFLTSLPKPCAIFAANDRTAAEVLDALTAMQIPRSDYSIIGVDNYAEICEHTQPTLTSIEPDFRGGGSTAALMLMAVIRHRERFTGERHRTFGPKRIVRRLSTTLPPSFDAEISAALELIDSEACLGLTAANVVSTFKCSRDMAEIRFRKAVGMSILDAIQDRRLQRAKELLANPFIQLKSISDFCGYRSANAMQKFFIKKTGLTMSAYRESTLSARPPSK